MKRKYLIIAVAFAFILGAAPSGYFVFRKLRVNKYTWATYESKEFKFSIEYPKNLVPFEYSPEAMISFYPWSINEGFPSPVVIYVTTVWAGAKDKTPGLKELHFSPERNSTGATIYFGKRLYTFRATNLNQEDAERMIKSMKFSN